MDGDTAKLACRTGTERRKIFQIKIYIVRHEQVRRAVAIGMPKAAPEAHPESLLRPACFVTSVNVPSPLLREHHPAEAGHQEIWPAVIVIVSDTAPMANTDNRRLLYRSHR